MAAYPPTSFFYETTLTLPTDSYVRALFAAEIYEEASTDPAPGRDHLIPTGTPPAIGAGRQAPHERMREAFISSGYVWQATPSGSITLADLPSAGAE